MSHTVSGSFDFITLVTSIFSNDISQSSEKDSGGLRSAKVEALDFLKLVIESSYAKQGKTVLNFHSLPKDISEEADIILFHERIHYWQLISCPLQQHAFLMNLTQLRDEISNCGGRKEAIAGFDVGPKSYEFFEHYQEVVRLNFTEYDMILTWDAMHSGKLPDIYSQIKLMGENWVTPTVGEYAYIPCSQQFLLFPMKGNRDFPGYGALLFFPNHENIVTIPFTGKYLMESAAFLAQLLYEKKPIPKPTQLDEYNDRLYLGAFEYWRRLHSHRYEKEENLILSFFAAVDLAISADPLKDKDAGFDIDYNEEMNNISYRFGKLAFRMQGFPPLELKDGEAPASCVAKFQLEFCQYTGWPSPELTYKKMAIALTYAILASLVFKELSPEDEALIDGMYENLDIHDGSASFFDSLPAMWSLFHKAEGVKVGQTILGLMLNACIYRIKHPGQFALPHLYEQEIKKSYPAPIVLYKGHYYSEALKHLGESDGPYPVSGQQAAHDVVNLLATKPTKRGNPNQCGFLDEYISCTYIKEGLGCPLTGLTQEEALVRERAGLDDWCHYTYMSVLQETAPSDVIQRWKSKWNNRGSNEA